MTGELEKKIQTAILETAGRITRLLSESTRPHVRK